MASSPIFSVNFTNRENSAVLNYHKSWSWSNQPVLWDFYTCIVGCSLLFSIQSMAWQATFDVITSWPFMRPPRKTGGKSLYALVPFWSWNTLQHYLVDVMMKQKSFFVQGNLNFALIEIISSFQYLFFAIEWTARFTENIGLLASWVDHFPYGPTINSLLHS